MRYGLSNTVNVEATTTNYISYLAEDQIPASYDWLWSGLGAVIVIALLVFWVASLISIIRSGYSGGVKVLLVMAAFAYPFLGPLVWFLFARNKEHKTKIDR